MQRTRILILHPMGRLSNHWSIMGIGISILCWWWHLIKLQGVTSTSLIHVAMEMNTLWTICGPKLYFLGYEYWTISPKEKQELEQPKLWTFTNLLNNLIQLLCLLTTLHPRLPLLSLLTLVDWLVICEKPTLCSWPSLNIWNYLKPTTLIPTLWSHYLNDRT